MNMDKETSLTVTKGSCIPLTTYQKSDDSVLDINYFGITLGMMNMTVFDVPKACMNAVHVSPVSIYGFVKYLLACRKHLVDRIISLRVEVSAHKIVWPRHYFIPVCGSREESGRSCICVLRYRLSLCFYNFLFLELWYLFVFHFATGVIKHTHTHTIFSWREINRCTCHPY